MITPTKRKRSRPEAKIQELVVKHLKQRGADGVFAFAVPNGGKRNVIEATHLKRQGVVAGVPDLFMVMDGKTYAMELKAPTGRPSEKQLEAIAKLNNAGAFTAVVYGLEPALRVLEAWGILRGKAQ